jgi:hypothetical protein
MKTAKATTAMAYKRKPGMHTRASAIESNATANWDRIASTRSNGVIQDLIDGLNFLIRRCMKDNNYSSDETDGTTKFSQSSKFLLEEI